MKPTKSIINILVKWDIKQFTIGFLVGILISILYHSAMYFNSSSLSYKSTLMQYHKFDLAVKNSKWSLQSTELDDDKSTRKNPCGYGTNGPKILCTVFTYKKNFDLKAQYVDQTWGKRCDKTIYMSGNYNLSYPIALLFSTFYFIF